MLFVSMKNMVNLWYDKKSCNQCSSSCCSAIHRLTDSKVFKASQLPEGLYTDGTNSLLLPEDLSAPGMIYLYIIYTALDLGWWLFFLWQSVLWAQHYTIVWWIRVVAHPLQNLDLFPTLRWMLLYVLNLIWMLMSSNTSICNNIHEHGI